jgi:hypothetical protein
MQDGFADMPVTGMRTGNAGKVREVEYIFSRAKRKIVRGPGRARHWVQVRGNDGNFPPARQDNVYYLTGESGSDRLRKTL